MRAFLFTGGDFFPNETEQRPAAGDLVLAADVGFRAAERYGIRPQILLGDFDSLGTPPELSATELVQVPAEKNFTDTQLAVKVALERGATELFILGGLGGRLDHTLSNLAVLEDLWQKKIPAVMTTGRTTVHYLQNSSILLVRPAKFHYLSLICAAEEAKGVTVKGCKYPLENATLKGRYQYAISNEWVEKSAFISVEDGGLWIIEESEGNS